MPFPQCYQLIKTYPMISMVHAKVDVIWLLIQKFKNKLALLQNLCTTIYSNKLQNYLFQQMPPKGTLRRDENFYSFFFFFNLCLIVSPFYTTRFILCPFDIASCLSELCEEAGWLHAVTGTGSQSPVYWWVTLLVCACKHIAEVPMPLPSKLLGRSGGKLCVKRKATKTMLVAKSPAPR